MTPLEMKERNLAVSETCSKSATLDDAEAVARVLNRFRWAISSNKAADLHPVGFFDKTQAELAFS